MDDPPSEQSNVYTPAEVEAALSRLKDEDFLRLRDAAGWLLGFGVKGWEPEDLVNEALERVVRGTRKWRRDVKLDKFVNNVMRSIVDEVLGENAVRKEDGEADLMGRYDDGPTPVELAVSAAVPLPDLVVFKESAAAYEKRILDKFGDDEVVLGVAMGLLDGMEKQEILDLLNITSTQYDTARTALRRAKRHILGKRARS